MCQACVDHKQLMHQISRTEPRGGQKYQVLNQTIIDQFHLLNLGYIYTVDRMNVFGLYRYIYRACGV